MVEKEVFLKQLKKNLGKQVGIYGYGRTGQALARILYPLVDQLYIFEDTPRDRLNEQSSAQLDLNWQFFPRQLPPDLDQLILSPGVALQHPPVQSAIQQGVELLGEVELAGRIVSGNVWAVTGTNGKSTTAELMGAILRASDRPVVVCGNRGKPFIEAVAENFSKPIDYVVEISSFQIETLSSFAPQGTVLTNLGDDHQDRHNSLAEYHGLKLDLVGRTAPEGRVVIPRDISPPAQLDQTVQLTPFSRSGVCFDGRQISWSETGLDIGTGQIPADRFPSLIQLFPENLLAALAVIQPALTESTIERIIEQFSAPPHRAELIDTPAGTPRVINDSKGTTPSAVAALVKAVSGQFTLLLGGAGKSADFTDLFDLLQSKADYLVELFFCGEEKLINQLEELAASRNIKAHIIDRWETAVKTAVSRANPQQTVLLSPGGTSFDAFKNYRQRGQMFKRWTHEVLSSD